MDQDIKAFLEEKFVSMDRRLGELPTKADVEKIVDQRVKHLAEMIHSGFTDASERLGARFDELDSRFRTLELSLFTDYDTRIQKLEQTVEKLKLAAGLS
jgi:hypothetical protein